MWNYLIVFTKNFDYISQTQIKKDIKIEVSETNLYNILNFCRDISYSLLLKFGKEKSVNLNFSKDENVPTFLNTDEMKLKQILINLISNAIKFTHSGFSIVNISIENVFLKFDVKDFGIGIKYENQKSIFQPYCKNLEGNQIGTGLGLLVVKDLTYNLGGNLQFTSEYGKGSIFGLKLKTTMIWNLKMQI